MKRREFTPIIKNIEKFNNIKLCNPKKLEGYLTEVRGRGSYTGESTKSFGDKWFIVDGKKAIFKTYDSDYMRRIKNVRMFNELLCQKLCEQAGIECAKYEYASLNNRTGLISYNFCNEDEEVCSLNYLHENIKDKEDDSFIVTNISDCLKTLKIYESKGYSFDKQGVVKDLYKLIVFDTLTMQTDRNRTNINFIKNNQTKELRVAPVFDNEYAFCGEMIDRMLTSIENKNEYFEDFTYSELPSMYSIYARSFELDNKNYLKTNFFEKINLITSYANKNEELSKELNNIMEKLDIDKAIKDLKKQYNKNGEKLEISEDYEQFICTIMAITKSQVAKSMEEENWKNLDEELIR